VEREPLIYHLDAMTRHSKDHREPPDEFFEVTMDDVRKRFAQLKSERWGSRKWMEALQTVCVCVCDI